MGSWGHDDVWSRSSASFADAVGKRICLPVARTRPFDDNLHGHSSIRPALAGTRAKKTLLALQRPNDMHPRLGESYRPARKSCSVFRVHVVRASCGREICLRCKGVFGIRVLLLLLRPVARWRPVQVSCFSMFCHFPIFQCVPCFCHFFIFLIFHFLFFVKKTVLSFSFCEFFHFSAAMRFRVAVSHRDLKF